ncbi:MAG: hypothetical protein MHM6MM_008434 [Cercozoa sp. M6MM]
MVELPPWVPAWVPSSIAMSVTYGCIYASVQPLDVLKTRRIMGGEQNKVSTFKLIREEARNWRSLWRGAPLNLVRVTSSSLLNSALVLGLMPSIISTEERHRHASTGILSDAQKALLVGALGRTIPTLAVSPLTVVKTRYEHDVEWNRRGLFKSMARILKHEGALAFWRGQSVNVASQGLSGAMQVGLFATFKNFLLYARRDAKLLQALPDWAVPSLSAAGSAVAMTVVSQPLDVVRTVFQATPHRPTSAKESFQMKLALVRDYRRQFGLRAFFRGCGLRATKRGLANAAAWGMAHAVYTGDKRA